MSIEAWGILVASFLTLVGWGVDHMPISNSWVASIALWCLAMVVLLATLAYWRYHKKIPQQTKHSPSAKKSKKAGKPRLPLWLRRSLVILLVLGIIASIVFGSLNMMTHLQAGMPTTTPTEGLQLSHPSPQEILNYIDSLYPYQREEAMKDYEGLSVTWAVSFFNISTTFGGELQVQSQSVEEGGSSPSVFFTIDINDYPEFRTMGEGQEFIVQGTISLVGEHWIKLGDCHIIFP